MIQSQKLCVQCSPERCVDRGDVEIECPICRGFGCDNCNEGMFTVECPREYCRELNESINMASLAGKGFLPVAGGLLDQTNWFVSLWQQLEEEHQLIRNANGK